MGMDRAQQVPGLVSMWGMCGLGHKSTAAAAFWILAIGWQHIGTQAQIHGGENQVRLVLTETLFQHLLWSKGKK